MLSLMKCLFSRLSAGKVLWTTLMQSLKAFRVYADLIKDSILLMIIVKALGDNVLLDIGRTFAGTVSKNRE